MLKVADLAVNIIPLSGSSAKSVLLGIKISKKTISLWKLRY